MQTVSPMATYPQRVFLVLLLLAGLAAGVQNAHAAACQGHIVSAGSAILDYDPFSPVGQQAEIPVLVENTGQAPCRFNLRLANGEAAASFGFSLRDPSGANLTGLYGAGSDGASLSSRLLDPGGEQRFALIYEMAAGQFLPPGRLEASVTLELYPDTQATAEPPFDSVAIRLACVIRDHLGVNIAGAGLSKTVDFGELTAGDRRRVVVDARANRNFVLEIASANGGAMVMAPPYESWRIGYDVTLDGRQINLPHRAGPFRQLSISAQSFSLEFAIGDVSSKRAGLYTDEIIVTIRPVL